MGSSKWMVVPAVLGIAAGLGVWLTHTKEVPAGPRASQSPASAAAPTAASAGAAIKECAEAPGALPMSGPCIPRAMRDVPPDPGPENDATLAGVDANRNGVRDDVERYIAANFGESAVRVASLMQYARANAPFVEARFTTSEQALEQSKQRLRATDCALSLIGEPGRFNAEQTQQMLAYFRAADSVRIQYVNTYERLKQFTENESLLGGQVLMLPKSEGRGVGCDFTVAPIGPADSR